jgi:hypothetical protein
MIKMKMLPLFMSTPERRYPRAMEWMIKKDNYGG